jgi:hypothetical protein
MVRYGIIKPSTGSSVAGSLQLASGVALDATLRSVTDEAGNTSALQLSTTLIGVSSAIQHSWNATPTGLASRTTTWFDATGRMNWRLGTGAVSYIRTFDASNNDADRVYVLPNNNCTLLGITAPIDATLRSVIAGGTSPLQLSTTLVGITSNINIGGTFTNLARLHVRGDGGNPIARLEHTDGLYRFLVNPTQTIVNVTSGGIFSIRPSEGTSNNPGFDFQVGAFGIDTKMIFGGTRFEFGPFANNAYDGCYFRTVSGAGGVNSSRFSFITNTNFNSITGTNSIVSIIDGFAAAAGSANFRPLNIIYTINNSGAQTGTASGIFLNAIETNLNGMTHRLMDLQVGGVSRFRVNNNGTIFATLQTGNAALVTGQMYKDTAANILSNSDFVVGMKA